jgi:trehalose 6-phosphate synthase/phosphatase
MPAILLIANRLPFTVRETPDGVTVVPSAGGLAVGMRPLHEASDAIWIGWTGVASDSPAAKGLTPAEWQAAGCVPVPLTRAEIASFYDEYANGALWPVFHSMTTRMPLQPPSWVQYETVNRRFAELALEHAEPETAIWVHDYHLMRVPLLVRRAAPAARMARRILAAGAISV